MKNKMSDLRNHFFETLEALKDEENPMDLERAKVVALVGKRIIDLAKVEVALVKEIGNGSHSEFFDVPKQIEGNVTPMRKLGS